MTVVVRRATVDDVATLVELRFAFVTEFAPDEGNDDAARASVAQYLARTLASEEFLAWLVLDGDSVVATGGMVVYERMMRSKGAGVGSEGYILNVYTLPEHRRRGHAMRMMQALLDRARERGIRLTLVATEDGVPLYRKLGFTHDDRNYRWWPE
jgi:ribosomal protein S18 acetylase RimI-like enzyme